MSFICHIHNYTEYNQQWNLFSAFNPSKCTHTWSSGHTHTHTHTHPEQWATEAAAPGEQLGVRCLAQGSHLSHVQFLPEPRFEPTTLGYKTNSLSIRTTTARVIMCWLIQLITVHLRWYFGRLRKVHTTPCSSLKPDLLKLVIYYLILLLVMILIGQ